MTQLTEEQINKILEIIDHGIIKGKGIPTPGKMCVEAAVCYGLGLSHSDDIKNVGISIKSFIIGLNDSNWSSDKVRALGLRKLAIAQLESDQINLVEFSKLVLIEIVKLILSLLLEQKSYIEEAKQCRNVVTFEDIDIEKINVPYSIYIAHKAISCAINDSKMAYAASGAVFDVIKIINSFEGSTDKILEMIALIGVNVLVKLKSPGIKYI